MRAFGREDARDAGHGENVALLRASGDDRAKRCGLHLHLAARNRFARGDRFVADVDHTRATARVEVRERSARSTLHRRKHI